MPPSPALTISGPPGSGTTTIAKLLKDELGLRYVYAGAIFRKKAEKTGMSLADFGDHVAKHPEIDIELDQDMKEDIEGGDVIVEGRVSGWLAHHHSIPAFKVFLAASEDVRAQRVANREGKSVGVILAENREREDGERERYLDVYGFDVEDTTFYDLVIDTDDKTPEEIVKIILDSSSITGDTASPASPDAGRNRRTSGSSVSIVKSSTNSRDSNFLQYKRGNG